MYLKEDITISSQKNEAPDDKFGAHSGHNFDSVIEQKDKMFDSLETSQTELSRDELLDLNARVFENSVKDGLSLATKLRLTPTEIADIISSPSFILKHSELAASIESKLRSSSDKVNNNNLANKLTSSISKVGTELETEPKTGEEMMKKLQIFETKKLKPGSSSQLKKLVGGVDDYYSQFVAQTELESVNQKGDIRTKGEKLAEESLGRILPAMEEKYLAGEVVNTLYDYLKKDDPKVINQISNSESNPKDVVLDYLKREGWSEEDISQLKYGPLVSKELIDNFNTVFKFDKLTERKLSAGRYKPLDLVYNTGKTMAKESLIKEIEQSIKSRSKEDVKVIFNKETKEYEVKGTKLEAENKKKEGVKVEQEKITSEVKEIDISKYSVLDNFCKVGERLAFSTEGIGDDGFTEKYIVTEDGQEIGKGKGYEKIFEIENINNQIIFSAKKDGKWFFVTEDGRELGKGYDNINIRDLKSVNNELAFLVDGGGDKWFLVTEDGRELGREYDNVVSFENINNQIVLQVKKDNKSFVVTEDGREIGRKYDSINCLQGTNNKVVFRAQNGFKTFIVTEDGRELGKEYDGVSDLETINNQLFFISWKKGNKSFVVTEDGRELGKGYYGINSVQVINNQIVFMAQNDGKWFIATEDGRELGKEYDKVENLENSNDQIIFSAEKNGKWFFVTGDGRELGKEYDAVISLLNINNQIVFTARKDGEIFIVTEDGRELRCGYDDIKEIFSDKNEVIIVGLKEVEDESSIGWKLFKETIHFGEKEIKDNVFELSESEKNKLDLLNIVNNPEKDKINDYFINKSKLKLKEENSKTAWQKLKSGVENSKTVVKGLNKIISKIPEVFSSTVKAQADRNRGVLRDQLLMKIFPEIYKSEPNNWLGGFNGSGSHEKNKNNQPEDPSTYLNPEASGLNGGDPSPEHGEEKEVMVLRDKLNDFISSSLLGKGLDNPEASAKLFFSLNHKSEGPFTETTVTLPNIGNLKRIQLPKPITANVILERVKGVTKNNEEILLETEINSLGEVNVLLGNNKVEKVIYSIQVSQDPLDRIIPKTSDSEYGKYQERFIKENGQDLLENIADLPEELEFFAQSLKSLPPKERIIAIEQFVKQYGYYDFKNGEINNLKNGKNASEQVLIMEMRMDQLKEANPELKNKKYAGVCSDFALLNSALLRKAGILSGVATGFGSGEKTIYPSMAHAVSYVAFPDSHNLNQVFIVDPTPSGVNAEEEKLLAEFREPSIGEKEAQAEEEINAEKLDALKSLDEIEKTIGIGDLEALKKLTNGKLEDALNTILKYEVKADNLKVVSNLLSSYWYSPLSKLDVNSVEDQAYFKDTFKKEISRVKSEIEAHPELKERPSGSELFNLIKDFKNKFAKNSTDNGLDLIDKIVDINKAELSITEQQALTVISNYLRAKNMLG